MAYLLQKGRMAMPKPARIDKHVAPLQGVGPVWFQLEGWAQDLQADCSPSAHREAVQGLGENM